MNFYALIVSSVIALAPVAAHDCHGYSHHGGDGGYTGCDHHDCVGDSGCMGSGRLGSSALQTPPIEMLKGIILEVRRGAVSMSITEAWVKTGDITVLVRLGPDNFLQQKGLLLKEGEQITVKGYYSESSDKDLMIATEVDVAGKPLLLRSPRGRPAW